jgi:calcineurin-like phosphoesterase
MTGPINSVIGIEIQQIIQRFLTAMPARFETARGQGILSAVVMEIRIDSGRSAKIQRLQIPYP